MASFVFPCYDYTFEDGFRSGIVNGGTVLMHRIAKWLRRAGHDAQLISLEKPSPKADFMMVQSEWDGTTAVQSFTGKKIVLLGHFIKAAYPDPRTIKADLFLTAWKGELLDGFTAHYWPHAYDPAADPHGPIPEHYATPCPWVGNPYALRDEGWLEGLPAKRLVGVNPDELNAIYAKANVCPNIHADCQKGIVAIHPSRIADKPGMMLNERVFNIIGAGGTMVCDAHPMLQELLGDALTPMAYSKDEFKEMVNYYLDFPEKGRAACHEAHALINEKHTYAHRVSELLTLLDI